MPRSSRRGFLKAATVAAAGVSAVDALAAEQNGHQRLVELLGADGSVLVYLPFDGDTRPLKGKLEPTIRGGEASFVDGPIGAKAISFEKGRYSTSPAPAFDVPQVSVSLFFRIASQPRAGYNPCIFAKRGDSPRTRFSIHVMQNLNEMALWNGRNVVQIRPPTGALAVRRWYHLVVSLKRDGFAVWLDGVPCATGASGIGLNEGAKELPFQLAASAPEGAEHFDCAMADVAVFSRMLAEEDVSKQIVAAGWVEHRREMEEARRRQEEEARRKLEEDLKKRQRQLAEKLKDPRIFELGQQRIYRGEHLGAISFALGGIGSGCIQMNGKAQRHIWQIFNNFSQANVPDSFFAIRAAKPGGKPIVRALQTEAVGPFAPMKSLSFLGEFPFAWYDFEDAELPVRISLEAFTPFIPMNAKASAVPCAIFNFTITNTSDAAVDVDLLATQQNAVGYDGKGEIKERRYATYGGNRNRIASSDTSAMLHMTSDNAGGGASGDMALVVIGKGARCSPSWDDAKLLHEAFAADGAVGNDRPAGPTDAGQTLNGALSIRHRLAPAEKVDVTFFLTWHFPNGRNGGEIKGWQHDGNMYANWFTDALDVARHVETNLKSLTEQTRLFHDTFYTTSLPRYLLDRITSQLAILRSKTCFWAKDGYFGAWEGCAPGSGCCAGSCTHVWHYAQAHARLFPELARIMRESTYSYQHADGGLPHRHPSLHPALDGHCGDILGAYREYLCGGGEAWLANMWPKVRKAMDYAIKKHDADEDGVLAGAQWNTLDGYLSGNTSWIGSLYLAALVACEKMALLRDEKDVAARYRRIRESGAKKQDQTLFNGEYYIQIRDPQVQHDYGDGCEIDQVLGEWWAKQLDLPTAYPPEHVRTALSSLLKYNFRGDFKGVVQAPRKFVADEDSGLQMIQWPKGNRPSPTILYGDEVMTGFEYSAAAAMVQNGMVREGLMLALCISDRYDGRLRTGLTPGGTSSWGYSGNPFGDDECGKFYARAMSVWSMLLACQGFTYDGPAGIIGFAPAWNPEDHISFFTGSEGWGLFTQKRDANQLSAKIELKWGSLAVQKLVLGTPQKPRKVSVSASGKPLNADLTWADGRATLALGGRINLKAGESLAVEMFW